MPLDGNEPIEDSEVLYRRIPVSTGWYDPSVDSRPSPEAFRPREDEDTGISLVRGGPYCTIQEAAAGKAKKGYYVAELTVGELRRRGIRVEPRPVLGDTAAGIPPIPGHVELPDLTAANRDSEAALNLTALLANELCGTVHGPFRPATTVPQTQSSTAQTPAPQDQAQTQTAPAPAPPTDPPPTS